MKSRIYLLSGLLAASVMTGACSKPAPPPAPPKAPAAPAAAPKPQPPTNKPKKSPPADKKVAVPANWTTMYDEVRGYEFQVPEGSKDHHETHEGVDVFMAQAPEPSKAQVLVLAFKDKKMTKEDLLGVAKGVLGELGQKDITIGKSTELSDDYDLVEATMVDAAGTKSKVKILLATDVTDNYIMVVGTDEKDFTANEQIIDAIWGSFSMYSGGASGNS